MSSREKILLLVAFLVASGMGYWALRYRPALAALRALEQQAVDTQNQIDTIEWPPEPVPGPTELRTELEEIRREIAQLERQVVQLNAQRVPVRDSQLLQELRLEISRLAQDCGLVAERESLTLAAASSSPSTTSSTPAARDISASSSEPLQVKVDAEAWTTRHQRPVQQLEVRCTYEGLRRFIAGLDSLTWDIVVLRLEVEATEEESVREATPLRALLVLGL